jgi:hypothetical protein
METHLPPLPSTTSMDSKAIPSSALKLAMYVPHGPNNNTIFDLYSLSHIPEPLKEPSFLIPLR